MAKYIQITVEKPCDEHWESMQASGAGNYCQSCKKTVIDFSSMTDNQVMQYFKKTTHEVCGRFHPDQLDKKLEIPTKNIPWLRYFVQISLPAMLLTYKASAQRVLQGSKEAVVQSENKEVISTLSGPVTVSGVVKGFDDKPVAGASVMIKGTQKGTVADSVGHYSIHLNAVERFLEITAIGYSQKLVRVQSLNTNVSLDIIQNENVIMIANVMVRSESYIMGATRVHSSSYALRKDADSMIAKPSITHAATIYPNPSPKSEVLTIRWNKAISKDVQVVVYNASGMKIFERRFAVKAAVTQLQFDPGIKSAGYYLVHITAANEKEILPLIIQ